MARVCKITGKRPLVGNNVSKSLSRTKRRQYPNLQSKRIFVPELGKKIKIKLSVNALKTIDKYGLLPFLNKKGAKITYYDPSGEKNEFYKLKNVYFCDNIVEACHKVDLVIVHTDWDEFKTVDFNKLVKKKKFKVYDMRNLYSAEKMKQKSFDYFSVGR